MGVRSFALGAAAVVVTVGGMSAPAEAATGPAFTTSRTALDAALHCPAQFVHPDHEPVLLVHGTGVTDAENWSWGFAQALRGRGYDVCGVDLPGYALGDIQASSEYVVNAVRRIHAATGQKVDVAGHSQGNLQARWALRWWPEIRAQVDDLVTLGAPSHGILAAYPTCLLSCFPAAWQMRPGARFLQSLNGADETPGDVSYTSIYTFSDEWIMPSSTAQLAGATNVAVQDVCPGRVVTHVGLVYDAVTFRLLVDAFAHPGAAAPTRLDDSVCGELTAPGVSAVDAIAHTAHIAAVFNSRLLTSPRTWSEPALRSYTR